MPTYRIARFYQKRGDLLVIERGLTLEEAQTHCKDPETSSSTCKNPALLKLTEQVGPWFDGYEEE